MGICFKTCCKFVANEYKGKGSLKLQEGNKERVKISEGLDPGVAPTVSAPFKSEN